ncbi:MAG: hypothetical protein H0T60_00415 [Acidobacteria bacterium]|nr:hypothetical protein [Acidobacteriota bacterium]
MSDEEDIAALTELTGASDAAPRRFSAAELIACDACARANPPTRMNCIYCGAPLPSTAESEALRRPSLRKLEEWEQGFNVVLLPARDVWRVSEDAFKEASTLLRLEAARLEACIDARRPLPLARASTREEAELITRRLGALGLAVEIVSDEELCASRMPKRIRALVLDGEALVGWSGPDDKPCSVAWDEVRLLVAGRIYRKRVEVEERQRKLKGRSEIIEEREMMFDEAVLELFASSDAEGAGWRIMAENFDYSCLGERKGLLARDNFDTLVEMLRARSAGAEFDDEYVRVRQVLGAVWPVAERTESLGLRRSRPGRLSTEVATIGSNEMQFTRYARLRNYLARREHTNLK